jgi:hypothetical protein
MMEPEHKIVSPPSEGTTWIASFDIGAKNFAFCIEEINLEALYEIQNIKMNDRYDKDGSLSILFSKIIHEVTMNGNIIVVEHADLTDNGEMKANSGNPKILVNMTNLLESYSEYWTHCSTFIIEQQMSFGNKRNTMALKLGQHCFSYFIIKFALEKCVIEFPAYYKTKIMGAPKKMTKHARKMWSVEEAIKILLQRNDHDTLDQITNRKKRDDVADVIVQLQSFKYLHFVDKKFM